MQNFVRRKPGIYRGLGFYRQDRREHREKGFLPPRSQRTPRKALPLLKPPAAVGVLGGYSWRPGFLPPRSQRTRQKTLPSLEPIGALGVLGGYSWRPGFLPPRSQRTPRKKHSHS